MLIRSFAHKGLLRLYGKGETKGIPANCADKLRKMLLLLENIGAEAELRSLAIWKAHQLSGNRKGTWSLHVTGNWRLTFDIENGEVCNLNLEDYH
ncbi:MAG: hypothetical protein QOH88_3207 [Verrucomicrobiota bacterium]|jgi:proteic killer suppression protein